MNTIIYLEFFFISVATAQTLVYLYKTACSRHKKCMREDGWPKQTGVEVTHFFKAERNLHNVCGVPNEGNDVQSQI